jgi:hypothetical protein
MKLRALSPSIQGGPKKFGQLCLCGMVNVPTDLTHIQTELPREFSVDDTVLVKIKRRLQYKRCYETENVRPYKILKALQYLTTHATLWRDAGVQLRKEFLPLPEIDEQEVRFMTLSMRTLKMILASLFNEMMMLHLRVKNQTSMLLVKRLWLTIVQLVRIPGKR